MKPELSSQSERKWHWFRVNFGIVATTTMRLLYEPAAEQQITGNSTSYHKSESNKLEHQYYKRA